MKRKTVYGDAPFTAIIDAPKLSDQKHTEQMRRFLADAPEETATIRGFFGQEDAVCVVCQRGIFHNEPSAQITTDTEPAEYLGELCRECCLKALNDAK